MARLPNPTLRKNGDMMMTAYAPVHVGQYEIAIGLSFITDDEEFNRITRRAAFDRAVEIQLQRGLDRMSCFDWAAESDRDEQECLDKAKELFPDLPMKEGS